jgi:hypothetical protein
MTLLSAAPLTITTIEGSGFHQIQNWPQAAVLIVLVIGIAYVLGQAFKRM